MKWIASSLLAASLLALSVHADLPRFPVDPKPHDAADEPNSAGTVAAGLALAAALGIGGTLAVKKLRAAKEEPDTGAESEHPAEAK